MYKGEWIGGDESSTQALAAGLINILCSSEYNLHIISVLSKVTF